MIYLVPQTICNFYLCAITFMQHTHADVPHFEGSDWTWLRGALSTIDRKLAAPEVAKTSLFVEIVIFLVVAYCLLYTDACKVDTQMRANFTLSRRFHGIVGRLEAASHR